MSQDSWLRSRRTTLVLVGLTLLLLVLSVPGALRDASERDSVYLLSGAFVEDLIKRLTGPGRFRFVLQPLIATFLGIRGGLADAKAGRPPFLYGLSFHREHRRELVKSGVETVANLLMMGILMDSIFQWVILGASHPVAALLVGPVLIVIPYALARAISNRIVRRRQGPATS